MRRLLALIVSTAALALAGAAPASAACVDPYCAAPTVSATGATSVSDTGGTLTGTVNPNNSGPTSFAIVLSTGAVVGSGTVPDGTSTVGVVATATGLASSTTYSYSITVRNAGGTRSSSASSFTTLTSAASSQGGDAGAGEGSSGTSGAGGQTGGGAGATPQEAQASARDVLDKAVKQITGFSALGGQLTVYVAAGSAPTRTTPTISGSNVALSTAALDTATTQNLMAVACVALRCTTTVAMNATIPGGAGGRAVMAASQRVALPRQRFTLRGGEAGVVKLKLTKAIRQALGRGRTVTLTVSVTSTDDTGTTRTSTKTLRLRVKATRKSGTAKPKSSTGRVAPAFTG
jgi:hypothetical protein